MNGARNLLHNLKARISKTFLSDAKARYSVVIRPPRGYQEAWFISSYLVDSWGAGLTLAHYPTPNAPRLMLWTLRCSWKCFV